MLLPAILLLAVATQGLPTGQMEECCSEKTVGGDRYINIGSDPGATWESINCLSACIFKKEGEEGSKYCFAAGDMKVECEKDMEVTPRPGGESNGPEMTSGPEMTPAPGAVTAAPGGSEDCKCGVKKATRVVGGAEAEVNEYPWIAIFGDGQGDNLGGCSSTLIADRWAITASHCFFNQEGTQQVLHEADMTVVLGIHDRTVVVTPDTPASLRQSVKIAKINLHPQYNHLTSKNDIALLRLATAVPLQRYTPACLPTKGASFTGKMGWVYGWGVQTENGQELAQKLQELEVPIVSDTVCGAAMDAEGIEITQDMLCAGGELNKDACGGDSGGPFTVAGTDGSHTLAGAVSFGVGCGKAGLYGVYAEVSQFRDWIDSTIAAGGGATFCKNGA